MWQFVFIKDKRVNHRVNARHLVCHRLIDVIQAREALEEVRNRAWNLHAFPLEKVHGRVDTGHDIHRRPLREDAEQILLEFLFLRVCKYGVQFRLCLVA
ncbi:MAG: hypothetical protein IJS08_18825 [Victivallales bacterium]|nr:hypothetical protein [Victivallales bacterium]